MIKHISIFLILIPSALNAMNETPSSTEACIVPVFCHARADRGDKTIDGACFKHTMASPLSFSSLLATADSPHQNPLIGYTISGTECKLLETIPNDETKEFAVLFALRKSSNDPWDTGAVIAQYDSTGIQLGDAINGVQYSLRIPDVDPTAGRFPTPPIKKENLSILAQEFLALAEMFRESNDAPSLSLPTIASNSNNNNNQ